MVSMRWLGALAAAGALMCAAGSASAEPATAGSPQIGIGFRYGFELHEGDYNPWGVGIGVDGGFTFPVIPIYVGGVIEYFFGDSVDTSFGEYKSNLWQIQAEGGYDIGLGPIVLRPKVGLGYAHTSFESPLVDDSSSDFALAPGLTAMLFLPAFSLHVDARYDLVFAERTMKGLILSVGFGF